MRKTTITPGPIDPRQDAQEEWLDLEHCASIEVTSEDPDFPVDSALAGREGPGWRAVEKGTQVIRLIFDNPRTLHRIKLVFSETDNSRTQEFTLRWSRAGESMTEIVRQQWSFSPQGSTSEVEDYQVNLDNVSILELELKPDLTPENAVATLAAWRVS
jgi:hypothetical protein